MKKLMLLSLLFMGLFFTKSQAQHVQYGIKAGLNHARWGGDAAQSFRDIISLGEAFTMQHKSGFHLGGYVEVPVTSWFSIEPALYYSTKGQEVSQSLLENQFWSPKVTFSTNAQYIDLPVLAKFYIADGFYITAGPQVSYLLGNKVRAEGSIFGFDLVDKKLAMDGSFRNFDFAISGGAGYKFANGINLSASYDYGLSSLDQNSYLDAYNRVAKISLGYMF